MARKKKAITVPLETIWEIPDAAFERLQPILAQAYPAKPTGRGRIDFRKATGDARVKGDHFELKNSVRVGRLSTDIATRALGDC